MRLGQGEGAISVADVRFLGDEEEEGSEDETHDAAEEEEEDVEEDHASRNGKGKAKRGRGRPKASTRTAAAAAAKTKVTRSTKPAAAPPKATTPLRDSVKILLNGSVVDGREDCEGEWDVELRLGPNVLEVGEDGGMIWKVYMERISI
jgi:chromatin structure-remodeling complex subunit RSC4